MAATVGDLPPKETNVSGATFAAAERKLPLPPPGHEAPWFFSLRPPHDNKRISRRHDRAIAVRISTKNDGSADVVYNEKVPEKYRRHRIIASQGNCMFLESPEDPDRIYLFDPFTWTVERDFPRCVPNSKDLRMINVVTHGGLAVAIAGIYAKSLVYMRLGSTDGWIARDKMTSLGQFTGLIVRRDYGLFYALSKDGEKVVQLKFVDSSKLLGDDTDFELQDMTLNLRCGFDPRLRRNSGWCCLQQGRLVDSPSGLFLVRWRLLLKGTHKKREIDVYKLSADKKKKQRWVPVHSLDNFSFFLGFNQSLAASTEQFPDMRSNLIHIPYDASYLIDAGNEMVRDFTEDVDHNLIYDVKTERWGHWDRRLGMEDRRLGGMLWPSVWMIPPG